MISVTPGGEMSEKSHEPGQLRLPLPGSAPAHYLGLLLQPSRAGVYCGHRDAKKEIPD